MGHEFEPLSGKILEAAVAVHRALGPGFLESVYQKAMEVALRHRNLPFEEQKEIHIVFEDEEVGLHRLEATGLRVGLLLNFNAATVVVKRIVL